MKLCWPGLRRDLFVIREEATHGRGRGAGLLFLHGHGIAVLLYCIHHNLKAMQSTTTNYGSKFCRLYVVVGPADGVKVAYLGNHEPEFSTEQNVAKAFRSLDWEVIELQENRATWQQAREAGLASDLLLFTSTWETAQPFYETLETLRLCAMRGIPTATLHLDISGVATEAHVSGT